MRHTLAVLFALTINTAAHAQFTLQDAHTTADLRGIDNVGGGVAWASGTDGTILRTEDAGVVWQLCAKPPGGEHLDFRAIQAFDNNTAIIMSSGKGDQSRLYKTTDGCQSWKLLFTNPDNDGFWDALIFQNKDFGMLLGDPVHGSFFLAESIGDHKHWIRQHNKSLRADSTQQGVFAASNSSLLVEHGAASFGTGGSGGAFFQTVTENSICLHNCPDTEFEGRDDHWLRSKVPLGHNSEASGLFSLARGPEVSMNGASAQLLIAVGGDYTKPNDSTGTAAYTTDGGKTWTASTTPPHGYRSAVAYDATTKTWITVGPNGTDISTDDGRNWHALKPDPAFNDTPDADQHWNALSLPYAVGPHGRIGTLRPEALTPAKERAQHY